MNRDFSSLLKDRQREGKHVCVGLEPILRFDFATFPLIRDAVDSVSDLVCAFKVNPTPFFGRGDAGFRMLLLTVSHIISSTDVPVILDMKCGDISAMNKEWKRFAFDTVGADAITVNPWGGFDALDCFFDDTSSKGVFVWCRSSSPGHSGPQTFLTNIIHPVHERVVHTSFKRWGMLSHFGVILGSTDICALARARHIVGDAIPILVPGVGHQGGIISEVIPSVVTSDGDGFIINVGRSVMSTSRSHSFVDTVRCNVEKVANEVIAVLENR